MKTRTNSSLGALHPILFFAGVYAVALLFSIFICSSLFYSCNATSSDVVQKQEAPTQQGSLIKPATAAIINK